ncbi:MAG TPA: (d)CMP kinase [Gemmatimonadales bacterium]|nr:(d)CMP kinase [Gemmatimonadales bacterium]
MRVIAVDGPAASGKSSTARAVARRLGWAHLDSGALYRAVTLAALDNVGESGRGKGEGWSPQTLISLAETLPVRLVLMKDVYRPVIAGVSVAEAIRQDRVTQAVSEVAAMPEVRQWVNRCQREAVREHSQGVVVDGRDIGTAVFPDAPLKIFLTATPEERARRRIAQRAGGGNPGAPVDAEEVRREAQSLALRDYADSTRAASPLRAAHDAVQLDTSSLSLEEQVAQVVRLAQERFRG